jgi:outer membrane protein OmpA-like peptidoglycan-associated protein
MKRTATLLLGLLCLSVAAGARPDKPGCVDHPLFPTRMPGYWLSDCSSKDFDAYEFFTSKGPKHREEGKLTVLTYAVEDRKNEQSGLAVVRNYETALKKIGGTIAAIDPQRWVNGQVAVDGRQIWVQAEKGNGLIWVRIVEKAAMQQHIVADAASFGNDLKSAGHAAVYGILFDTGRADIKPESEQAIGEIAKLLKADPGLKVFVVGHTDAVGGVDANLNLSQERAEAVLQALVRSHGIAAARLRSFGNGPFAPVASNDAEEGRAKNRRVELVKQ